MKTDGTIVKGNELQRVLIPDVLERRTGWRGALGEAEHWVERKHWVEAS